MSTSFDPTAEWLETDGLGGYATGPIGGPRTRRYHALLCAALAPPVARHTLVNGFDAFVTIGSGESARRFALTSQKYAPDFVAPDGAARLAGFTSEPWPTWTFRLEDGTEIAHELCMIHGAPVVALRWTVTKRPKAKKAAKAVKTGDLAPITLTVRPFLSGRDHHALHHENGAFRFDAEMAATKTLKTKSAKAKSTRADEARLLWRPYSSLPAIACLANGAYRHEPHWYRAFRYDEEAARGFDATEDLGSPGELTFDLTRGPAVALFGAELTLLRAGSDKDASDRQAVTVEQLSIADWTGDAKQCATKVFAAEAKRRAAFGSRFHRAADQFLVRRGAGRSIVAGYPWFSDWGRDTFIALRGLCLATGRIAEARSILMEWAGARSQGMLPNRFVECGETPEFNSVDASLWFIVAVEELLHAAKKARAPLKKGDEKKLLAAVLDLLETYAGGARHGIRMDEDALLAAGEPGHQITWMDARTEGREVTPRIGKPVEIQALWFNALSFAAQSLRGVAHWKRLAARVRNSFLNRFWNEQAGCLFDVVDVDHERGKLDASVRPNQLFAVGGLPRALLVGPRARRVVDLVERTLVTPRGVRTLAPDDPRYCPRYEGTPSQRDAAYHQGTAWPWLLGPFTEAWARTHGDNAAARKTAFRRFFLPLVESSHERGVPHLAELADADSPHAWRGGPAQAWSLAELLRVGPHAR